jgi:hypothetical protein
MNKYKKYGMRLASLSEGGGSEADGRSYPQIVKNAIFLI